MTDLNDATVEAMTVPSVAYIFWGKKRYSTPILQHASFAKKLKKIAGDPVQNLKPGIRSVRPENPNKRLPPITIFVTAFHQTFSPITIFVLAFHQLTYARVPGEGDILSHCTSSY